MTLICRLNIYDTLFDFRTYDLHLPLPSLSLPPPFCPLPSLRHRYFALEDDGRATGAAQAAGFVEVPRVAITRVWKTGEPSEGQS